MAKQFIIIVVLTALAAFFMHEFIYALHMMGNAQAFLINKIVGLLPHVMIYKLIVKILVIILVPAILAFLAAFVYWLIKRQEMPKLMEIIWVLWIISLLVFALYK
jgi:hypothetical protein